MAGGHGTARGMSATATFRRSRVRWLSLGVLLVLATAMALALMPSTTLQGVDFKVSTIELPLYVKALDFVDRDVNYRALARKITAGLATDEARVLAVFEWVRARVRDVPAGFPVVDDHIWHILVRGYGAGEQKADVFTTLTTYAGVPGYFVMLGPHSARLPIALVLVERRWRVVDVEHGFVFRNTAGQLATFEDLAAGHGLVERLAGRLQYKGREYAGYFARPPALTPPGTLRAEMQMLGPRLIFELKRAVGIGGSVWDPTAGARPS
jgi:hypothetical protein